MTKPSNINIFINIPEKGLSSIASYKEELDQYKKVLREASLSSLYISARHCDDFKNLFFTDIIGHIKSFMTIPLSAEIGIEVSSEMIMLSDFEHLVTAGFNRISFSLTSKIELDELQKKVTKALLVFPSVNVDISLKSVDEKATERINDVADMKPHHISIYGLTTDDEFLLAKSLLEKKGYSAYDPFHFCLNNKESRYLSNILRYEDYIGLGPNAHGCLIINGQKHHHSTPSNFDEWSADTRNKLILTPLSNEDVMEEYLLQNLTLVKGIDFDHFYKFFDDKFASIFNVVEALKYTYNDKPILKQEGYSVFATEKTHEGAARATYALLDARF